MNAPPDWLWAFLTCESIFCCMSFLSAVWMVSRITSCKCGKRSLMEQQLLALGLADAGMAVSGCIWCFLDYTDIRVNYGLDFICVPNAVVYYRSRILSIGVEMHISLTLLTKVVCVCGQRVYKWSLYGVMLIAFAIAFWTEFYSPNSYSCTPSKAFGSKHKDVITPVVLVGGFVVTCASYICFAVLGCCDSRPWSRALYRTLGLYPLNYLFTYHGYIMLETLKMSSY